MFLGLGFHLGAHLFWTGSGSGAPVPEPITPVALLPEVVASFEDASGWTAVSGVTYAGGEMVADGTQGSTVSLDHVLDRPLAAGEMFALHIDLSDRVAGGIYPRLSNGGGGDTGFAPQITTARQIMRSGEMPTARSHARARLQGSFNGTMERAQVWSIQDAWDAPLDVYVLAGQSNMAGGSARTGFDLSANQPEARALYIPSFDNWAFGTDTDATGPTINPALSSSQGIGVPTLPCTPLQMAEGISDGVSPGVSIITAMMDANVTQTGRAAVFIGAAQGGTGITGGNGEWSYPGLSGGGTGELYDLMRANIDALLARNAQSRVAGVFWCQGESDGPNGYAPKCSGLFNDLRGHYGQFPIVLMETGFSNTNNNAIGLRAEFEKLATGSGDLSELSNCVFVPRPTSWALESDGVHYTATTNVVRGREAGEAMADLLR